MCKQKKIESGTHPMLVNGGGQPVLAWLCCTRMCSTYITISKVRHQSTGSMVIVCPRIPSWRSYLKFNWAISINAKGLDFWNLISMFLEM